MWLGCLKTLLALDRSSVLKMAFCCSCFVPASKCCCIRPRISDTAIWASLIVAGPYFLALLLGACHLVSHCVAQQLETTLWICLVALQWQHIHVSQLESLTLLTGDVSKDDYTAVNDSIQVIFATRFIWRQHSIMTTLLFHRKTYDVVFLKNYVILCTLVNLLEYQVLIRRNAIPPLLINMKILFHVWNLILFKGQKYH